MPGPVLQLVDFETFTVGLFGEDFFSSGFVVGEGGFEVGDADSIDAVAVGVYVSVTVGVSVGVDVSEGIGVREGVSEGVKVGGGSSVGV